MSEIVELKPNPGRRQVDLRVAIPDDITLNTDTDPQMLIEVLRSVDGDLDAYAKQWVTRSKASTKSVIFRTVLILNREGNEDYLADFHDLLDAHKQAQALIAESRMMRLIGDYEPPKNKRVKGKGGKVESTIPLSSFKEIYKTAMAGRLESEKVRGRKSGAEDNGKSKGEPGLEEAVGRMLSAAKNQDTEEDVEIESD